MQRIEQEVAERLGPFQSEVARLCTIPGVDRVTAWGLLAEIGLNMNQFPDAQHLASWAGLGPGSHESAGKRKSGKIRKGSLWLRRCLCQGAWAVSTKKNNYLSALYRRLAARRGTKRATIAVAPVHLFGHHRRFRSDCRYAERSSRAARSRSDAGCRCTASGVGLRRANG
jgi:transposase